LEHFLNSRLNALFLREESSVSSELQVNTVVQIHRSFIVNTNKIQNFTSKSLTMINGEVLPVGRKYQILLDNLLK
jgi:DNA-binding LytR/AlgR family response regulator